MVYGDNGQGRLSCFAKKLRHPGGEAMANIKWYFDFHLLEQGWVSTPPCREPNQKMQPPGGWIVTLRMVELGSDEKPDTLYKAEVTHIDSNRAKVAELIARHGLPKAILVNCWAQKQALEEQLANLG